MNSILKFIDRFKRLFETAGIEYDIMRKILQVKFLMDSRRVPTLYQSSKKPKKEGNYFFRSLWVFVLLGVVSAPIVAMGNNYIFQMAIVFSIIFFTLFTAMLSDYSTVLLDIRDRIILHTRPIKPKTINAAKTVHICVYMFFITMAVGAIPLIIGAAAHGILFAIIFLFQLILVNFLTVVITAFFYFVILRFFDGEKLKDFINYVQIVVTVSITIGYQIVVRAFDLVNFDVVLNIKWWHYLLPPLWYAAPYEWVLNDGGNRDYIILTILALAVPIAAITLYIKLMRAFEHNLQKLAAQGEKGKRHRLNGFRKAVKLICYTKEEQTFFRFAGLMMKKERDFKLKVYPALGFSIIFPFIFLINNFRDMENIGAGEGYFSVYACLLMIPSVIVMLQHSGKYKGAWVFKAVPLKDPSPFFKGTLKAFFIKLFLPLYVLLSLVYLFIFGWHILLSLITVLVTAVVYALICFKAMNHGLPFSEPIEEMNENGGWKIILFILIIGIFIGAHYLAKTIPYGLAIYTVVLLLLSVWLWKKVLNITWQKLL
ncbi:MAG: hypothetical protein ACO1OC_06395 [Tuberibacillus sp.]